MKARRRGWVPFGQFLLGMAVVAAAGVVVWKALPQRRLPPGWLTIRPPRDVMALLEFDETIWSGGRDGVAVVDRDRGQLLHWEKADVELRYVTSLATDGDTVWVGHDRGLSHFTDGAWKTVGTADGLPADRVLALCYSEDSGLWVGTTGGLANLGPGQDRWAVYTQADGLAGDAVSVVMEDSQGRIWAGNGYGMEGGLSMYDGRRWTAYDTRDGLAHNMVNAILEMPDGALWFGTGFSSRGGATRYDGETWSSLSVEDGLAGGKVRSLFLDQDSALWFGSEYDGIARFDGRTWRVFTPKDGLAGWEVKAMLQDSRGNLWLGTENGLSRLSPGTGLAD
jgi:ligand-binding sensor domain-containing protein